MSESRKIKSWRISYVPPQSALMLSMLQQVSCSALARVASHFVAPFVLLLHGVSVFITDTVVNAAISCTDSVEPLLSHSLHQDVPFFPFQLSFLWFFWSRSCPETMRSKRHCVSVLARAGRSPHTEPSMYHCSQLLPDAGPLTAKPAA